MSAFKDFFSLIGREFSLFWKNSVLRMLFIGAPILYGIFFGMVYEKGKVTDLPMVVIDEDDSPMSRKMIDMLQDNETLCIAAILRDKRLIKKTVIRTGADCTLVIPKNFEAGVLTKRYPEVALYINTDNILTANYASKGVQLVLGTLKAGVSIEALKKQGVPAHLAPSQYEPFRLTFIRNYNRSANYMYFLWPGFLATILQQVLFLALALSFASEFENKTFGWLCQRARTPFVALVVKLVPYLIMSFFIWLFYGLLHVYFRVPPGENIFLLTLIAGLFVLAAALMGILVSILLPNQLKATEILMVIATPSFVLSGFTWPISQMPAFIKPLTEIIPLTHFLKAYRILTIRGGDLGMIGREIFALVAIITVCFALSLFAVWRKIQRHRVSAEQLGEDFDLRNQNDFSDMLAAVHERVSFFDSFKRKTSVYFGHQSA